MPWECYVTFGRIAATRGARGHVTVSQRWIGWDGSVASSVLHREDETEYRRRRNKYRESELRERVTCLQMKTNEMGSSPKRLTIIARMGGSSSRSGSEWRITTEGGQRPSQYCHFVAVVLGVVAKTSAPRQCALLTSTYFVMISIFYLRLYS